MTKIRHPLPTICGFHVVIPLNLFRDLVDGNAEARMIAGKAFLLSPGFETIEGRSEATDDEDAIDVDDMLEALKHQD